MEPYSIVNSIYYNIFYYYNHIVKSTIIILYYIFLVDIAIKNIFFTLRKIYGIFYYILYLPEGITILNSCHFIVTNTIYFSQCSIRSNYDYSVNRFR